jgi:hypothetical protein
LALSHARRADSLNQGAQSIEPVLAVRASLLDGRERASRGARAALDTLREKLHSAQASAAGSTADQTNSIAAVERALGLLRQLQVRVGVTDDDIDEVP